MCTKDAQVPMNNALPSSPQIEAVGLLGQGHSPLAGSSTIEPGVGTSRRLIAARVQSEFLEGNPQYSYVIGVSQQEPLTSAESSAVLLLFPYDAKGDMREGLEPLPIQSALCECTWYWCGRVSEGCDDKQAESSLCEQDFVDRVDALEDFIATGKKSRLLDLAVNSGAFMGYFHD